MEILSLIKFVLIQVFGLTISFVAAGLFIFWIIRKFHSWKIAAAFSAILVGISFFLFMPYAFPERLQYPFFLKTFGPADGPSLPFKNIVTFFIKSGNMERVASIAHDPNNIPPPINRTNAEHIKIELETK